MAHIVYQCQTAILKQIIDMWKEIIKGYLDCRYEGIVKEAQKKPDIYMK